AMPIDVTCPNCKATLRAPDASAGKKIKCPKCETITEVPAAAQSAPSPVSAVPPASPSPPPAPPPATASAAPPRDEDRPRRRDYDDDRPRLRRYDDDDDYDRGSRRHRGPRRDAHETEPGTGLQLGLGIGSICLGVISLCFSFIPC